MASVHGKKITYEFLQSELIQVIKNPAALEAKITSLITRMLQEMNMEEIIRLDEAVALNRLNNSTALGVIITGPFIEAIVEQVKTIKPNMVIIHKAGELADAGELDEAVECLKQLHDKNFASGKKEMLVLIAQRYRERGENVKATQLDRDIHGPITWEYLQKELSQVATSPAALQQKVVSLTPRLLTELSLQEIERLESIAENHSKFNTSPSIRLISSIIETVLKEAKSIKPQFDMVQKAQTFFKANQLDEAAALLKQINDKRMEPSKKELSDLIANKYRQRGETHKADEIEGKSTQKILPETPAERVTVEAGKNLFNKSMRSLQALNPKGNFPPERSMDNSLERLHQMSLISSGRDRDVELEQFSIDELKEKLAAAEAELEKQRVQFEAALKTGNQSIVMTALEDKQKVMQEALKLKSALHHKGVDQTDPGNPEEMLDNAIKQGVSPLMGTPPDQEQKSDDEEVCVIC